MLHFQFFSLGPDFPVTLASVGALVLSIGLFRMPSKPIAFEASIILSCLLALPLLAGVLAQSTPFYGFSSSHFLRTYALWSYASICSVLGIFGEPRHGSREWFRGGLRGALAAISILAIGQFIAGSLGTSALYNIWGKHQYLYEYAPNLQFGLARSEAFYLEPAYAGMVIAVLMLSLAALQALRWPLGLAALVGLATTQSPTAFAVAGAGIGVLRWRKHIVKAALRRIPAPVTLGGIGLLAVLGPYLLRRLSTLAVPGSSAYYRVIAPLSVLGHVLSTAPLGAPLGSVQRAIGGADLLNGSTYGTSLDNGVYLLIFYSGWVGIIVLLLLLTYMAGVRGVHGIFLVALAAALLFVTGGILLPEFSVLILVLLYSMRIGGVGREPRASVVIHNNNSFPRLARIGPNSQQFSGDLQQ